MLYHFTSQKVSPSFEDKIIKKTHSSLDHTVENASCFVQSLSNYNSLNHALSLYVDVHYDQLSNSANNSEYLAQNQYKQISQIDEILSSEENSTNGYLNDKEVIETKTLSRSRSAADTVQLRHVQTKEQNIEASVTNGNRTTEDSSNKENEENYENEEYTKIPVRDLISTFEKQTRPVIRYKLREDKLTEPSKMTIGLSADVEKLTETVSCVENNVKISRNEHLEQTNSDYSYSQNGTELRDDFESSRNENILNGNNENADHQQGKRFYVFSLFCYCELPVVVAFLLSILHNW